MSIITSLTESGTVDVAVIGAGAAGMMAAIEAARAGAKVLLIERNREPGKKLATTGNGRCNYTNLDMENLVGGKYRGCNPEFSEIPLESFGPEQAVEWFRGIGIEPKYRGNYVYPNSDQASSVVTALWDEVVHSGVQVLLGTLIRKVRRNESEAVNHTGREQYSSQKNHGKSRGVKSYRTDGFLLDIEGCDNVIRAKKLILATGSRAVPKTGSTGDGYVWSKALGHSLVPQVPALTAVKCKGSHYKNMAGVRTDAKLCVKVSGETVAAEEGELQLTDYGISGIPVFQISRHVAYGLRDGKEVSVYINFLPHISEKKEEIIEFCKKRAERLGYKEMGSFFTGLLNQKLGNTILQLANIDSKLPVSKLSEKQLKALGALTVSFKAECVEVNPFANAQCAAGGINTAEVDPHTMESKLVKGLYFAGEILDIDGICGGYNLQWAWSSGFIAGNAAAG
ncbi:aminoacetone oxidase family FAD-binding enzyme [Oribacterium sp. FC2011]|uniref:aminoacetone oxidase family FAD-binding enzyme n=1 Tax=Oribacterium sp. FC2011 TaxID=1408311 RepID=UPI000678E3B5|nr:aminoacetone oxidase family FAD-binding enzyme [Oribacterium sp. FC2011]